MYTYADGGAAILDGMYEDDPSLGLMPGTLPPSPGAETALGSPAAAPTSPIEDLDPATVAIAAFEVVTEYAPLVPDEVLEQTLMVLADEAERRSEVGMAPPMGMDQMGMDQMGMAPPMDQMGMMPPMGMEPPMAPMGMEPPMPAMGIEGLV